MRCLDKQSQKIHKQLKVTSQNQLLSGRNWPPSLKKSLSTEKKKKKKQWPRKTKKLLVVNISQTTTDVLKNRSIFFSQWSVQIRHKSYRFLLPRDGCSSLKACQVLLQLFDAFWCVLCRDKIRSSFNQRAILLCTRSCICHICKLSTRLIWRRKAALSVGFLFKLSLHVHVHVASYQMQY